MCIFNSAEQFLHRQARSSVSLFNGSESLMYKLAFVFAAHTVILVAIVFVFSGVPVRMSSKTPYVQGAVTLVLIILILYVSSEFFTLPSKPSAPYIQTNDANWKGWANVDNIFSLYVCLPP